MDQLSKDLNKEIENIKKSQLQLKNTITARENTTEGVNSKSGDAKEQISDLEDRAVEIIQVEWQKEKKNEKSQDGLRDLWDHTGHTTPIL